MVASLREMVRERDCQIEKLTRRAEEQGRQDEQNRRHSLELTKQIGLLESAESGWKVRVSELE
jgi:cytidylate kinase